ncbi:MAG TPA: hypothetical protein VL947_07055 [Cytophagales bacterium]|nr:hypothetical protein [Cytophagales bacterium]
MAIYTNEVAKKLFSNDVQEKLFPDNSFYKGAQVDTGVADDKVSVDIPQDEDGEAESVVNPSSFPLEVSTEEDKKKSYEVDLIATKPTLVTDLEQSVLSYDKRSLKTKKHLKTLQRLVAERILQAWAAQKADYIRVTTGTSTRAARAKGATGLRKRVSDDDLLWAFSVFNDLDIPMEGRRLVAPAYMYEDMVRLMKEQKEYQETKNLIIDKGAIGIIYGFNIFMRSTTTTYTEAATPVLKAIGAQPAVTDNQAINLFHTDMVRYAEGNVKAYINQDQGQFLGTTMNFKVRAGGCISRLSEQGSLSIVEDNG